MGIKELRQAKADNDAAEKALKAEGRKLMAIAADKRTPEQTARMDAITTELDAKADEAAQIAKDLAFAERVAADERAQGTVQVGQNNAELKPWGPEAAGTTEFEKKEARHMALGAYAQAVRLAAYGKVDDRLQAVATGGGTQVDSAHGFAIPQEIAPGIERDMYTNGDVLSRVDARTITGNAITYNVFDETSRADGSRGGGVLGYWLDEGVAPTASNTKRAKIELKLRKVGTFGVMTDELLEDAVALGGELEQAFTEELIFQVENKIFRGSGAGAPQGFLNANCLVSVAKETNQTAATIVGDNITKMWARMPARSQKSAVWLANVDAIPQLSQLAMPIGTAGIRYPYANVSDGGQVTLWGRPVIFVEYAETVGTVGDLSLVDLSKYRLIRKGGIQQASSMHVYFATGEQAFRAFYRVDGQAAPRAAVTPFKGANTLSPFVVLATRS